MLIRPAPGPRSMRRCSAWRASPEHAEPSASFQNSLVLARANLRAARSAPAPGAAMLGPMFETLVPAGEGRWGRGGVPLTLHSAGSLHGLCDTQGGWDAGGKKAVLGGCVRTSVVRLWSPFLRLFQS